MTQDDTQETRESPALDEVEVPTEVDDGSAPVSGGESPQAAQDRAYGDDSPLDRPEVQILGAFVGAFVLAKLLQWMFGRH